MCRLNEGEKCHNQCTEIVKKHGSFRGSALAETHWRSACFATRYRRQAAAHKVRGLVQSLDISAAWEAGTSPFAEKILQMWARQDCCFRQPVWSRKWPVWSRRLMKKDVSFTSLGCWRDALLEVNLVSSLADHLIWYCLRYSRIPAKTLWKQS